MNVFDWLSELPLPVNNGAKQYPVIEVSFNKGSRKDFFRNNTSHTIRKGDWITVEGVSGFDVGQVSLTGELVKLQMKKYDVRDNAELKKVLRLATDSDFELFNKNKEREPEVMIRSRAIARNLNLQMKIAEVEMQADGKKATFFYIADDRVDFRELIKIYASDFKLKVEMRQIGARQESGKVGGIGSCGRELCCSTWLTDFKSVNTTAARYQNLSINQVKLSGQCGRLKCCLNYELDTYMDALSVFPDHAESIQTTKGTATLQKRDIFKNLMWYSYSDSNKQYPLSIVRVKEILKMNRQGERPDELQPVELEVTTNKAGMKVDMGFVNDVGHISLKSLEKGNKKSKKGGKQAADNRQGQKGGQQADNRDRRQGAEERKGGQGQKPEGRNQQQADNRNPQKPKAEARDNRQQNRERKPDNNPQPQKQQQNRERRPDNRPQRQQGGERPQGQGAEAEGRDRRPDNRPQQQAGEKPQGQKPQNRRPDNRNKGEGKNPPQAPANEGNKEA